MSRITLHLKQQVCDPNLTTSFYEETTLTFYRDPTSTNHSNLLPRGHANLGKTFPRPPPLHLLNRMPSMSSSELRTPELERDVGPMASLTDMDNIGSTRFSEGPAEDEQKLEQESA